MHAFIRPPGPVDSLVERNSLGGVPRLSVAALLLTLGGVAPLRAQPTIRHEDIGCLPRGEFTQFLAGIDHPGSIRSVKLYFRSELYPEFYFVEMTRGASSFEAVLPRPTEETTRVVYYIEAIDVAFETARSRDYVVDVSKGGDCRRGQGAVPFLGEPAIQVGAVATGLPALPAGFQASGVVGFLSAAGAATGTGLGLGVGVAVGAAAGAATGVGVLVAAGSDEPASTTVSTTSSPPLGDVSSTTSAPTGAPGTTTSSTPAGPSGTTTSAPTETTSTAPGTSTTIPSSTSAPPESTSTVPATTTSITSGPTACFSWQPAGMCRATLDAGCSGGSIASYDWTLLGPPVPPPPSAASFVFDFASDPRCGNASAFTRPVRLRVVDTEGRSDTVQQNISVPQSFGLVSASRAVAFTTRLVSPTGEMAQGSLSVDGGAALPATSAGAARYRVRLVSEEALILASLRSPVPPGTLWEFDFGVEGQGSPPRFRVESGTLLVNDGARIVFRLTGDPGEQIRFGFEAR